MVTSFFSFCFYCVGCCSLLFDPSFSVWISDCRLRIVVSAVCLRVCVCVCGCDYVARLVFVAVVFAGIVLVLVIVLVVVLSHCGFC